MTVKTPRRKNQNAYSFHGKRQGVLFYNRSNRQQIQYSLSVLLHIAYIYLYICKAKRSCLIKLKPFSMEFGSFFLYLPK